MTSHPAALSAVLVDVGGTLWPSRWPACQRDAEVRVSQLGRVLPELTGDRGEEFVRRVMASEGANGEACVREAAQSLGLPADAAMVLALRKAMCLPALGRIDLFDGARELLAGIKERGLSCVVVTHGVWRGGEEYRRAFEAFGVSPYIDAIISSVDMGFPKPHPILLEAALAACGSTGPQCVSIGNSEINDVEPSLALGMRVIRVAIEEPLPAFTRAHATAPSLRDATAILRAWF